MTLNHRPPSSAGVPQDSPSFLLPVSILISDDCRYLVGNIVKTRVIVAAGRRHERPRSPLPRSRTRHATRRGSRTVTSTLQNRFGHFKHQCKNEARCIVCGDNMHGDCNKPEACRNCEGAHRSTKRSCPVALRNKEIKTIMAYNNVTFFEAERLLKLSFANQNMTNYDRYTNPSAWPRIGHNNKERENETEIKITEFSRNTNNGNNTKENKTTANHQVNYRTYYKDIERDREEEERRRQERREIEERERRRQERREREREKQE
ncbi:uncharacterized protein LOC113004804 isoform X3 [Solenopsis invicta]|uniref:uncharacterized protein LOC113004804 isoform X3 n=1 Tax=Solenopsis invicta TaxID=13686 RepID=UPI00193E9FC6|nr:uncharacterized protein LOC113004804 isoform X3 [Solenopsis invicta]